MRGSNLKITIFASVLLTLLIISTNCKGEIIYVDEDAVGANNGSNWDNAYLCLQDALGYVHKVFIEDDPAEAQNSYEIRVANGIYKPDRRTSEGSEGTPLITASGDRTGGFWMWDVTVKGGYAGYGEPDPNARDINLYETILSGDLYGNDVEVDNSEDIWDASSRAENSYHVVTSHGYSIINGFTITGGNANDSSNNRDKGGGLYLQNDTIQIINCKFSGNSALSNGGGIYSNQSDLSLTNCTFVRNVTGTTGGGGMYNYQCDPILKNCTFVENLARYGKGGGIYNSESDPILYNCTFNENSADSQGGGMYNRYSSPRLTYCAFRGNSVSDRGGGIYNFDKSLGSESLILRNCLFSGNHSGFRGGGIYIRSCEPVLTNCTFAGNWAGEGNALYCISEQEQNTITLTNCILWDFGDEIWNNDLSIVNIFYSNIKGGWFGEGNIDEYPQFADPNGPDHKPGTEDDDLKLTPLSPCIDSGDSQYMSEPNETDLDNNLRIIGGCVDMGAYEFQYIIYVDDDAPGDPGPSSIFISEPPFSDPLENGSESHPMDSIQEAIDIAKDGYTVLVRGGIYREPIDFKGKAITVTSGSEVAVLEAPGDYAVSFLSAEGPDSVLKNFVIRNSVAGVFIPGSSPTIRNLTAVDNEYGVTAYTWAEPDISNCIFWNNSEADLFQCEARYSCIEDGNPGEGNIRVNPLFIDADNGDYHLMSEGWRWNGSKLGAYDDFTSFCIDAGDPVLPLGDELVSAPRDPNNKYGINLCINMGAYGGTYQASMPPLNWIPVYETDPPEPNPAQWAYNGEPREVREVGERDTWIQMTAAEATDASGPVEYLFEHMDPHYSSGWQSSRTYSVQVGTFRNRNSYRVKARDMFGNETEWSEELMAE
jgi:predicted outer membrane repeat protein